VQCHFPSLSHTHTHTHTHTARQAWPKHTGTLSSLLAIHRLKASLCVLSAHLLKVHCSRFHLNIKSFLVTIKLAPCMPRPPEDVFFSHLFPAFEWCKIHLSLKSRSIDIAVTLLLWLLFEAPSLLGGVASYPTAATKCELGNVEMRS
jgi:hypothetical protein